MPPGIRNPKTFLEAGRYLHTLLVTEMSHGCDTFLAEWKEKPKAFGKAYQTQFIAYPQGAYPFTTPLTAGQTPLQWWMAFGELIRAQVQSRRPHQQAAQHSTKAGRNVNRRPPIHCSSTSSCLLLGLIIVNGTKQPLNVEEFDSELRMAGMGKLNDKDKVRTLGLFWTK